MTINWPAKDPDEIFDYLWEVALDEGDSIALATITKISGSVIYDNGPTGEQTVTGAKAWLSGGTDGETNVFEGRATTIGGRTFEETIYLPIVSTANGDANSLIAVFPAFATVPNSSIAFWLTRAKRVVDDSWPADDRQYGQFLLTAHYMVLQGLGTGAEAQAAAAGAFGFKRMKSGSLELERDGAGGSVSGIATTSYGRQFADLLRMVKGGPRVTAPGVPLDGAWDVRCGGRP